MSLISDFEATYGNLATTAAAQTGLTQAEVLGQWGLETGWGSHFAGANNFGNVSPGGTPANYSSPQEGVAAYVAALKGEGVGNTADPATFGSQLVAGHYAGDQTSYGGDVAAAVASAANAGASSAPAATSTTLTPTPLTNADGSSVSGPNLNIVSWLSSRIGDFSLVFFGLVLGVGALLISQKSTVIQVAKTVAK